MGVDERTVVDGPGYRLTVPASWTVERVGPRGPATDVIEARGEQVPLSVYAAVQAPPLPGDEVADLVIGGIIADYREHPHFREIGYGRGPVEGSDDGWMAELVIGEKVPSHVLMRSARLADGNVVTVQVVYPEGLDDLHRRCGRAGRLARRHLSSNDFLHDPRTELPVPT